MNTIQPVPRQSNMCKTHCSIWEIGSFTSGGRTSCTAMRCGVRCVLCGHGHWYEHNAMTLLITHFWNAMFHFRKFNRNKECMRHDSEYICCCCCVASDVCCYCLHCTLYCWPYSTHIGCTLDCEILFTLYNVPFRKCQRPKIETFFGYWWTGRKKREREKERNETLKTLVYMAAFGSKMIRRATTTKKKSIIYVFFPYIRSRHQVNLCCWCCNYPSWW